LVDGGAEYYFSVFFSTIAGLAFLIVELAAFLSIGLLTIRV